MCQLVDTMSNADERLGDELELAPLDGLGELTARLAAYGSGPSSDRIIDPMSEPTVTRVYRGRAASRLRPSFRVTAYLPITKRRNTCQSPIATFHPSGAAQLPRSRYHYGCASR